MYAYDLKWTQSGDNWCMYMIWNEHRVEITDEILQQPTSYKTNRNQKLKSIPQLETALTSKRQTVTEI